MENTHLNLPSPDKPVSAINQAFQIAREKLSRVGDVDELCRMSGAKRNAGSGPGSISVEYLSQTVVISLQDAEFTSDKAIISPREKLLVLHYLLTAKGVPQSGKLVTFQELPEGQVYYPTFLKRSVQPLVSNFGPDTASLLPLVEQFGGQPAGLGDTSAEIVAFPNLPVTIVLWKGDEEFVARGSILFDTSVSEYLPTEDITILCETISWRLIKSKPPR